MRAKLLKMQRSLQKERIAMNNSFNIKLFLSASFLMTLFLFALLYQHRKNEYFNRDLNARFIHVQYIINFNDSVRKINYKEMCYISTLLLYLEKENEYNSPMFKVKRHFCN
jgi:hypothetical protein